MKFLGNLFALLFCAVGVFAQNNITVSGSFVDKANDEALIGVSVELLNAKDSVAISRTITNIDGNFSMTDLSKGNYILRASYVSYDIFEKPVSLSENQTRYNAGKLSMEQNSILMEAAIVDGKRPEIIVKNDTIEYDAQSYKVTENAVIEDLLKKLPGVEVASDGKITVNGQTINKFLVNGKEFFSDDPLVASKNLPAEMVEKLQVINQRSEMARMTGFDDGDEEMVINITVREGMKQGTMGNALVGAGADVINDNDLRYQGAAFLNHMRNNDRYTLIIGRNNNNNMGAADLGANQFGGMRMRRGSGGGVTESTNFMFGMNKELSETASLNGDIRYNGSDQLSESKVEETTLSSTTISQLNKKHSINNYISDNVSANFRFEWKPDTMNTLIFRPNVRYNQSNSKERGLYDDVYNYDTNDVIFLSNSEGTTKGKGISFGGNLDYSHKFDKPGRVLSFNLRYNYNDSYSYENSYWFKETPNSEEYKNQRMENDDNSNNYQASVSWVEPLGRNNFLQATYRIAYADSKGINSTYDFEEEDLWWKLEEDLEASINREESRSTKRNSLEQRIGLNFKAVREKYNFTVGFNIDPSKSENLTYEPSANQIPLQLVRYPYDERMANILGDTLISEVKQNVTNFSPMLNFNYIFGQRSNLRVEYEGNTNQPSANQLKDFIDKSNPTNWTQGNPNLKPSYRNRFRSRFSKYVQDTQLMYNLSLDGNYTINDITSVTRIYDDGIRLTTYENVDGNWDTQFRGMFSIPLRNKKFTVNSFSSASYAEGKSYTYPGDDRSQDQVPNKKKEFTASERAGINYRSDLFDVGLNANIRYSDVTYSARPDNNQTTVSYGGGASTTWYLPHNFTIETDINLTKRTGYAEGYNTSEAIWNAAITKQLFNKKYGTGSLKLQIYDILQERSNISASATTNGYRTSESNSIPSFFMCSFIYKFTAFPKSSSATVDDLNGSSRWREGGGRPPGGGRYF